MPITSALRALGYFWVGVAAVAVGTLAVLGTSGRQVKPVRLPMVSEAVGPPTPGARSRHDGIAGSGGVIAAPDPALEEPAVDYAGLVLPRVGADGRTPMRTYAGASGSGDRRPRIGVLLTGIGISTAVDETVVDALPAAISFAISPYAYLPDALLQKMRERGHESFLSLPMEPEHFPADDPGPEALLTSNTEAVNQRRLQWTMSRMAGYVGVTNVMGTSHGERFAGSPTQMAPVLRELGSRGLMYIDGRPGAMLVPGAVGRSVDAVIDTAGAGADVDAQLTLLEAKALDNGSALAVTGPPQPVLVKHLASWAATLASRGFNLVPVSAVVPAEAPVTEAATAKQ